MRASRDPERERQLAGVEGAEAPRPRGGVAMIEEVEIGGLPGARLPAHEPLGRPAIDGVARCREQALFHVGRGIEPQRSEEHTSELQSLMRNSYAVFCLKKKKQKKD